MEESAQNRKFPLSQETAENRKSLLLHNEMNVYTVHYDMTVAIRRSADKNTKHEKAEYEGKLVVKFDYHPKTSISTKENLFLDFTGDVHYMRINDSVVSDLNYKDHRLYIDESKLNPIHNEVTVLFSCQYNHSGVGLHHYIDPIDKKEYLFTQFEPYDCHLMFPCFDQPDLKATLTLSVLAPNEWIVLSNEAEKWFKPINSNTLNDLDINAFLKGVNDVERAHLLDNTDLLNKNYSLHLFNKTPRISSYLFALCAGQYYCINNPVDYEVPLRIFMRESLKDKGDPLEMLKITMEGMEWYKQCFGIKYPFNKYDQIYCPEYNMGAMENVGLVTYNEFYCFKETPTQRQKTFLAIVVLHELAHMWFGNLVTMKWWNDLWLNESFATFISHLCLSEAKGLKHYTTSWLIFNQDKGSAFSADQKSTTHPVMGEVKNTEVAETHFDEIVYEKGSSILKQLYKFIGYEKFSKGLTSYFSIYKWENTVFSNFIDEMVKATGNEQLNQLCDSWLKKAGLNEITVNWDVSDNKVKSFHVKQTPCLETHSNLQTHLCDLALLYSSGKMTVIDDIHIGPQGNVSLQKLEGVEVPDAVIMNYNDWAYFKVNFDSKSIKFLQSNLYNKDLNLSVLSRQIFYRSIFDNARDSVISGVQFIEIVNSLLPHETNQDILSVVIRNLNGIVKNYIPLKYFQKYSDIAYNLVYNLLRTPNQTDDCIKILLSNLITFTSPDNKEQVSLLKSWLDSGVQLTAVDNQKMTLKENLFQQRIRFTALVKIFASNHFTLEEKNKMLEIECKRDNNSDESELTRFECRAALPDKAVKEELFNMYVNESTKESLYKMISSMSGFVQRNQIELIQDYVLKRFFDVCIEVGKKNDHFFTDAFINSFSPTLFVRSDVIERMEELVKKAESDSVRRRISENTDDIKRLLKAHNLCEQYLSQA